MFGRMRDLIVKLGAAGPEKKEFVDVSLIQGVYVHRSFNLLPDIVNRSRLIGNK